MVLVKHGYIHQTQSHYLILSIILFFIMIRVKRKGGGVAMFIHDSLDARERSDLPVVSTIYVNPFLLRLIYLYNAN